MSELELAGPPGSEPGGAIEYQFVRMDGTELFSVVVPGGCAYIWMPDVGCDLVGPVAGRWRVYPDGAWFVRAYYPDGYPGPRAPWPDGGELHAGESRRD